MTRIVTANQLQIDAQFDRWRLLSGANSAESERALLEAAIGMPLRYSASFAERRRLPESRELPITQIQRVVLGWSESDTAWHLGLLLTADLAEQRGSRWCEIARWDEPEAGLPDGEAASAGEGLARVLNRPFNVVPPRRGISSNGDTPDTSSLPVKRETPIPLPEPPFSTGLWTLTRDADGTLQYLRARAWMRSRFARAFWYAFWCAVYIFLSIATLNSTLALPNAGTMLPSPEILPYLGIASAVLLFGLVIYVLIDALTSPGEIVVDPAARTLTIYSGEQAVWTARAEDLSGVYVTHILSEKRKRALVEFGEINLYLGGQQFKRVLRIEPLEEPFPLPEHEEATGGTADLIEEVRPLEASDAVTPLQKAALHIAAALNVPCYYDQRLK